MRNITIPAALIFTCTAHAGDPVKTLTPEMYGQMKAGQKLEKVWVSPTFDKTKGFKAGDVIWKVEERNPEVRTLLTDGLKDLAKATSPYTMNLTVVNFSTGARGKVAVEGVVVDAEGKIFAAFSMATKTSLFLARGVNPWSAPVNEIISAIAKDLE